MNRPINSSCSSDNQHFGPMLGYCDHQAKKFMDRKLKKYDISPVQCRSLMHLDHMGGNITQKALEQFLMVKPSTVNGVVSRMEEKGLIVRKDNPKDARYRLLCLTEEGRRFLNEFRAIMDEADTVMEQGFSSEEILFLNNCLKKIANNLKVGGID